MCIWTKFLAIWFEGPKISFILIDIALWDLVAWISRRERRGSMIFSELHNTYIISSPWQQFLPTIQVLDSVSRSGVSHSLKVSHNELASALSHSIFGDIICISEDVKMVPAKMRSCWPFPVRQQEIWMLSTDHTIKLFPLADLMERPVWSLQ